MAYQPLPTPRSLRAAADAAARHGHPLVLMLTLRGCVFCELVRNSYLHPLMREGRLVAVQLDIQDKASTVLDFRGQSSTPAALAEAWRLSVTPTLLFLGPEGRELAERLEGVSSTDFYGHYLEQRVEAARAALKR